MFRRTDCHFSLRREDIDPDDELYVPALTTLLNAEEGRVYLDVARPRVCIRGAEERELSDLTLTPNPTPNPKPTPTPGTR